MDWAASSSNLAEWSETFAKMRVLWRVVDECALSLGFGSRCGVLPIVLSASLKVLEPGEQQKSKAESRLQLLGLQLALVRQHVLKHLHLLTITPMPKA